MRIFRLITAVSLVLVLAFVASACGQPAAAPTSTAPPSTPTKAPLPSPTVAAAKPTTAPGTAPTASPAAGGPSPSELASKARTTDQYSFDVKITSAGQTLSGKGYVKGTKMRQEITAQGMNVVMLIDSQAKTSYMLVPGQNTAMKIDFSQAVSQAPVPSEQASALPANSKYVGSETVDGKPAAVYESTEGDTKTKYWMWTEYGLPLKIETTSPQGTSTVEFTNYQIGTQPDSLFELPPGTQIIEAPAGFPGLPGGSPVPKN